MKKLLSLFFAISMAISACGTASTQPTLPAQTGTPTVTATQTPTSTITALPTIPTFTPTFDVSTIVTVTPAEQIKCPQKTDSREILLPKPVNEGSYPSDDIVQPILDFLNSGGGIEYLSIKLE